MKKLDQLLSENRHKMDTLEPDEGHFQRFQMKLEKSQVISIKRISLIAAALIASAFISVSLISHFTSQNILTSEMKETAWFYNSQSEKLLSEIESNTSMDNNEKQVVLNDLRKFDKEYDNLLEDLKKFPDDERLINAFINYHRSKTEILKEILQQINFTTFTTI